MVKRVYVYSFLPPTDPLVFMEVVKATADLVVKHNKFVVDARLAMAENKREMILRLTVQGHDQWWIKKRVKYPLAGILAKHGIKLTDASLLAVEKPEDLRSTRPRASDGRSTPIAEDVMIDHSDMMP